MLAHVKHANALHLMPSNHEYHNLLRVVDYTVPHTNTGCNWGKIISITFSHTSVCSVCNRVGCTPPSLNSCCVSNKNVRLPKMYVGMFEVLLRDTTHWFRSLHPPPSTPTHTWLTLNTKVDCGTKNDDSAFLSVHMMFSCSWCILHTQIGERLDQETKPTNRQNQITVTA